MEAKSVAIAGLLWLFGLAGVADAAPLDALRCHADARVKICEGKVRSFDGTLLDTTLTLPVKPAPARGRPLVVFLHGLLADKSEYLSSSTDGTRSYQAVPSHNRWFAARGCAVVNYSARGHGASDGEINLAS